MSEYTREEILKLIEENGGPKELDLSGKDLSGIDLSREAIEAELEKAREIAPDETPVWYSTLIGAGMNLEGANLQGTNLEGANLRRACLIDANLQGARLSGGDLRRTNLVEAKLDGANLDGACFREAILSSARLHSHLERTIFHKAKLDSANLRRSLALGVDFREADMSLADLRDVIFADSCNLAGAYLHLAQLDGADLTWDQIGNKVGEDKDGEYDMAEEVYLRLKNCFIDNGRHKDASEAYRRQRRMEKACNAAWVSRWYYGERELGDEYTGIPWKSGRRARQDLTLRPGFPAWHPRVLWFYARHTWKWLWNWIAELVCDYGEGLGRVAISLIAVWVSFALIYGLIAGVWGPWQDTGSGRIRYITRNPIDLLSFSLRSITTFAPIELEARPTLAMRILMPLEALLSIFLAGLLGFVAGKRIRRS